jgi:ketosteroid isomerase-like protein
MRAIEFSRNAADLLIFIISDRQLLRGASRKESLPPIYLSKAGLMKEIGFVVMACFALVFAAAQNRADSDPVTKVLALENVWNQAEARKDTKAMDALLDNALVYVDYDGSFQTKAEFLSRVKSAASQPQQEITESVTGHMFGGTVIVTGLYRAKGMENGKSYVRRGRFVDTWTLKAGSWVCVASQATPIAH